MAERIVQERAQAGRAGWSGWWKALASWDSVVILAVVLVVLIGDATNDGMSNPRFWRSPPSTSSRSR